MATTTTQAPLAAAIEASVDAAADRLLARLEARYGTPPDDAQYTATIGIIALRLANDPSIDNAERGRRLRYAAGLD